MNKWSVYCIRYNGEIKYVGVTKDFDKRKYQQLRCKQVGKGKQSEIPIDIDKTMIEISELASYEDKKSAYNGEDMYIKAYKTIENGWNKYKSGLVSKDPHYMDKWNKK